MFGGVGLVVAVRRDAGRGDAKDARDAGWVSVGRFRDDDDDDDDDESIASDEAWVDSWVGAIRTRRRRRRRLDEKSRNARRGTCVRPR